MNALDQESLVLRQIAALRRHGWDHLDALRAAGTALPAGAMRERVIRAQTTLSGGRELPEDLLARSTTTPDQLVQAATTAEARMWAQSAMRTGRATAVVPVVLVCVWATAMTLVMGQTANGVMVLPRATDGLLGLCIAIRDTSPILVLGTWFGLTRATFVPGRRPSEKAAALLTVAAGGAGLVDDGAVVASLNAAEREYFLARRGRVGHEAAAGELAGELLAEAKRDLGLFRELVGSVAVVVFLPFVIAAMILFAWPIFAMGSHVS